MEKEASLSKTPFESPPERNLLEENNKTLRARIKELNENVRLEALAGKLESIRDEERSALALEIHDVLGQALTVMKLDLAWISRNLPDQTEERIREKIISMLGYIDENIQIVRDIASTSRPAAVEELDQFGPAIVSYARAFENRTGIECRLDIDLNQAALSLKVCNVLFRIFQEAMTNVARHSEATEASIWLKVEDGHVVLELQDNGKGIPFKKINELGSLGIYAMKTRAASVGGKLDLLHVPQHGTCMRVQIPCLSIRRDQSATGAI